MLFYYILFSVILVHKDSEDNDLEEKERLQRFSIEPWEKTSEYWADTFQYRQKNHEDLPLYKYIEICFNNAKNSIENNYPGQ